jgi:anti-anti-sigma regulatory factor
MSEQSRRIGFMTNESGVIELIDGNEDLPVQRRAPGVIDEPVVRTSLESEKVGLLASAVATVQDDRRMEEWIASNLDIDFEGVAQAAPRSVWNRMIEGLPGLKRMPKKGPREQAAVPTLDSWGRFRVAYKRGITLVRLLDKSLVKQAQLRELARDLLDLIAAGNHRIVLNFQATARLASWVAFVVEVARRRCAAADGGALRVCGLPKELARVFAIAGVGSEIDLYADEAAAIESPWPQPSAPRALPVEILSALTLAADFPPIGGGSPSSASDVKDPFDLAALVGLDARSATMAAQKIGSEVWLRVQVGAAKPRTVRIVGPRFLVGRDRNCHLRLGSAMVSKHHAAIELRDERIFVSDLGSTNGTIINGRTLRSAEAEVHDGDRIQIGPVVATLVPGPEPAQGGKVEEIVTGWMQGDGDASRPYHGEAQPTLSLPATGGTDAEEPEERIRHEVIQDVLVITPHVSELDDPEVIEQLRCLFHALYEQPMPRQVVLNLEYVRHLTAQAIGVVLAHHLRLDRASGALRICQAPARVMAILHHVRLTIMVECHPTLDEAVLAAWPSPFKKPANL